MTLDEMPRGSRKRRSRKKRRSRNTRRYTRAIGWSLLALVVTGIFIVGAIYVVLSMRSEPTGPPVARPARPVYGS